MAYKLNIIDNQNNINVNVRYENLSKAKKPPVIAKAPNGKEVREKSVVNGKVLEQGDLQRQWVDEDGQIYGKSELTFWYGDEQVQENSQTKVLNIEGYQPLSNYTDQYVIATYYELFPDDNGMKKDIDREIARKSNLYQMRKLFEYLRDNKVVGRGEFCTSSRGFVASDGYIRAVEFGNKWGIEIGVFKEEKIFQHLNEGIPEQATAPQKVAGRKKIKMV